MEQNVKEFINILRDPNMAPSAELVEALRRKYPYFALPSAVMLQRCGDSLSAEATSRLRSIVALTSCDRETLYRLTGENGRQLDNFYPAAEPSTPSTDSAITTFLDRYGSHADDNETALLEKLIFNPVPADYGATLESGDDPAPGPHANTDSIGEIASLLGDLRRGFDDSTAETAPADTPADTEQPAATPPARPAADTTFSESLAKIYIKQQRFDKALEIISGLSLNFPEKSIYFADQMRFLKKLIQNRSYNSQE